MAKVKGQAIWSNTYKMPYFMYRVSSELMGRISGYKLYAKFIVTAKSDIDLVYWYH